MNILIAFLLFILSFATPFHSEAEQKQTSPKVPAILAAKAVAWQAHWDGRSGIASSPPSILTFNINTNSEVWVHGLKWIISFDDRDGELFPFYVEHAPTYMNHEASSPFFGLAKTSVKLPLYTNSFHKISKLPTYTRNKLLNTFKHEVCSSKDLAFFKEQTKKPVEKIRFWIAPVDPEFPVLLYAVEGVPYIGKVYFGTRSLKPLYSEFNYITDQGSEKHKEGLRLINGIKVEGTAFKIRNGALVPIK